MVRAAALALVLASCGDEERAPLPPLADAAPPVDLAVAPPIPDAAPIPEIDGYLDAHVGEREVCGGKYADGVTAELLGTALRVHGSCGTDLVTIWFEPAPAMGGSAPCARILGRRNCPETRLNADLEELTFGEATGEVTRTAEGRLVGRCECAVPAAPNLPAYALRAEFDLPAP